MLYLNESDIDRLISTKEVVETIDKAFKAQGAGQVFNYPRQRIAMPQGILAVMSGGLADEGVFGLKTGTYHGTGIRQRVLLWDATKGELISIMEAKTLGKMRTGAASGVAARYMAREDASVGALIGTGVQAETQLEALCTVRDLRTVKVYSRTSENRDRFISSMKDKVDAQLVPVESSAEAVSDAHIVCTITKAQEPVFDGKLLAPGATVIAAGSNRATNREVDDETVNRASAGRIVVDDLANAQIESGDLIRAVQAGVIKWGQIVELGLIASGAMPGRKSEDEINLFMSQGVCFEDMAIGAEIYKKAIEKRIGKNLDL